MPYLNSKYDFDSIAGSLETMLNDVANGSTNLESALESLKRLFAETFPFSSDPVGWHVSEISNRITCRLKLNAEFVEARDYQETSVQKLGDSDQQCTRSRISTERLNKHLILQLTLNAVHNAGDSVEVRAVAEKMLRCCPELKPSAAPFLDGPRCCCKNCSIAGYKFEENGK